MSSKGETNRRWTSSPGYRTNYDRIFAKVCDSSCSNYNVFQSALLHLDALTTSANQHRLAQWKQLCVAMDCEGCDERASRVRDFITGGIVSPFSNSRSNVEVGEGVTKPDPYAVKATDERLFREF